MAQRTSGYEREPNELYETPAWVTEALVEHVRLPHSIWEPAVGTGKMARVLAMCGHDVYGSDIVDHGLLSQDDQFDFLIANKHCYEAIVTNPPFGKGGHLATAFIMHALDLTEDLQGMVAMLLPVDFDSAKTRRHLFADNPAFAMKIILTSRIRWFEGSTGSPSANHCWGVWDWKHRGAPSLRYAIRQAEAA